MSEGGLPAYYVYVLKDPTTQQGAIFYVGKGTGIRAYEHSLHVDNTSKGQRIRVIQAAGLQPSVSIIAQGLTELAALKLEAELISFFGTLKQGGSLTNSVGPSGTTRKAQTTLNIPTGSYEKANLGLDLLKESVLELTGANPTGILNSDIVKAFGLQSDYLGGSKDYLTWSLLGMLMREGKIQRVPHSRKHILIRT